MDSDKLTIDDIVDLISQSFHDVCTEYKIHPVESLSFSLDARILREVAQRCVRDSDRIIQNHNIEYSVDSHKYSGYITYWICKLKPIKIVNHDMRKSSIHLPIRRVHDYINEIVAVFSTIYLINLENLSQEKYDEYIRKKHPDFCGRILRIEHLYPMIRDYLYTLRHCTLNPDLLSIMYYYMDINSANKKYYSWYEPQQSRKSVVRDKQKIFPGNDLESQADVEV